MNNLLFVYVAAFLFILSIKHGFKNLIVLPAFLFFVINVVSLYVFLNLFEIEYFSKSAFNTTLVFYYTLFTLSFLSIYFLPRRSSSFVPVPVSSDSGLDVFFKNLGKHRGKVILFIAINVILTVWYLLDVNIKLLLRNTEYLLLLRVEQIDLTNPIVITYVKLIFFFGIGCFLLLGLTPYLRLSPAFVILLLIQCCFYYIYSLAISSRSSALLILCLLFSISVSIKNKRKLIWIVPLLMGLAVFTYMYAIYSRGQTQGIMSILDNINGTISSAAKNIDFIILNLFAGAYTFYLGVPIQDFFPEPYKILSFSPLPSIIDGFDDYRKFGKSLGYQIPYSANLEVFKFGYFYIGAYFVMLYYGLKKINLVVLKYRLIGIILSLPSVLFFVSYQQYPLRSYFRYFFISVLVAHVFLVYQKRKERKRKKLLKSV